MKQSVTTTRPTSHKTEKIKKVPLLRSTLTLLSTKEL